MRRSGKLPSRKSRESLNDVISFGDLKGEGRDSGKRSKSDLRQLLSLAQRSTASMGSFDQLKKGEKPIKKISGKNAHFQITYRPYAMRTRL